MVCWFALANFVVSCLAITSASRSISSTVKARALIPEVTALVATVSSSFAELAIASIGLSASDLPRRARAPGT